MTAVTSVDLLAQLRQYRLLDPAQLDEFEGKALSEFPKPKGLARELMRRGWLSPYQVNQLFTDRGQTLLLGSYILVERLGGGGMGEVFKARNWKFGTTVAIKVIREERMADPRAVQRFHREIRAAAQLTHPNIVRAYDADEVNGRHLLVMEYVEGTDLARLVKVQGPLPVAQACDFIRQAAMGLQHAFERGMVHRDIKPHNLLLAEAADKDPSSAHAGPESSAHARIMILDMGLARAAQAGDDSGASGTMTHDGVIVGTPDYIAPEQARESHKVDIRADIYSLGCTFYFLLTGAVPFATGSLIQKLYKHQFDDPTAVESLRPAVPQYVGDILRKMMAKAPADRFQTPAELVDALAAVQAGKPAAISAPSSRKKANGRAGAPKKPSAKPAANGIGNDTSALWSSVVAAPDATVVNRPESKTAALIMPSKLWLLIGGSVLGLGLAILSTWLLLGRGPAHNQDASPPHVDNPPLSAKLATRVDAGWINQVAALPAADQVKEVARMMQVLNPNFDGLVKPTLERNTVTGLDFLADHVSDLTSLKALPNLKHLVCKGSAPTKGRLAKLTPLKGLPLESLDCRNTQVSELAPLSGMPLNALDCQGTTIYDLAPLKNMPLIDLNVRQTSVNSLAPLRNMRLLSLDCSETGVADITPLTDMPLRKLNISSTRVTNLAPLQRLRLTALGCRNIEIADLALLQDMPLHELDYDFNPWRDGPFLHSIKTLTIINELPKKNFWYKVADERAEFDKWTAAVAAMPSAKQVAEVIGELNRRNPNFRQGLPAAIPNRIVTMDIKVDEVRDLSPLRAFPNLRQLTCKGSAVGTGRLTDLSPLTGLKLVILDCSFSKVADLSPLQGMPLSQVILNYTSVTDLTPLKGMALTSVACIGSKISDLTPLAGMRLASLQCGQTRIKDLASLNGMPLQILNCGGTQVTDLTPLAGMPLTRLVCPRTPISDLAPLKGLPLTYFHADQTKINDLSSLRGMRLQYLFLKGIPATDLAPIAGMPLKELYWDIRPQRDLTLLNSLTTLVKINGLPAAEVLKQAAAK